MKLRLGLIAIVAAMAAPGVAQARPKPPGDCTTSKKYITCKTSSYDYMGDAGMVYGCAEFTDGRPGTCGDTSLQFVRACPGQPGSLADGTPFVGYYAEEYFFDKYKYSTTTVYYKSSGKKKSSTSTTVSVTPVHGTNCLTVEEVNRDLVDEPDRVVINFG